MCPRRMSSRLMFSRCSSAVCLWVEAGLGIIGFCSLHRLSIIVSRHKLTSVQKCGQWYYIMCSEGDENVNGVTNLFILASVEPSEGVKTVEESFITSYYSSVEPKTSPGWLTKGRKVAEPTPFQRPWKSFHRTAVILWSYLMLYSILSLTIISLISILKSLHNYSHRHHIMYTALKWGLQK